MSPKKRKPGGYLFEVTVRGKRMWQADKFLVLDGVEKRITGRGVSYEEAQANLNASVVKKLVAYGQADREELRKIRSSEVYTLEQWLDEWFNSPGKSEAVSPNTRFRQQRLIANHIVPHLGSKNVREVTPQMVTRLLTKTMPEKKRPDGNRLVGRSPIRGVYYILKPAFEEALKKGRVGINPMLEVEAPPKPDEPDEALDERGDIPGRILSAAIAEKRTAYWVLALYGLRQSERLGLSWAQFRNLFSDTEKPTLIIDRQLYNNSLTGVLQLKMAPKTRAGKRVIPLTETVADAFRKQYRAQSRLKKKEGFKPTEEFAGLCFLDEQGRPFRQNEDNAAWHALLQKYDIPLIRHHALRHLAATVLAESGTPPEVASSILGHTSTAMTSYYTHIGVQAKRPALEALDVAMRTKSQEQLDAEKPKMPPKFPPGARSTRTSQTSATDS